MHDTLSPQLQAELEAHRKSLTSAEERRFLDKIAVIADPHNRLLCELFYYSGCRVSELLSLRADHISRLHNFIVLVTLKQHGRRHLRPVPLPPDVIGRLLALPVARDGRIWTCHRSTARRRIRQVMLAASIPERLAHTKTFRHSYNARGLKRNIPEKIMRELLGHRTRRANQFYGDFEPAALAGFARQIWSPA